MEADFGDREGHRHFRVVLFGSARIERGDPNWNLIYDLAKRIAEEDMDIVTGGGPGLMNAASEGHYDGDVHRSTRSIGLQIKLPMGQPEANHLDIKREFPRFSERLDNFMNLANVVVVAPGGVGTLLEFFYTWQLIQVRIKQHIPIILLGDMWPDFIDWIEKWPLRHGFIDKRDLELLFLVKSVDETINLIREAYRKFEGYSQ